MRMYNRATRLGICAAQLAVADARLDGAVPAEELGLVTACTYGHLDTLIEYDRSLVARGPQGTNPALMPLALASAPGAMTALAFGAKAFSTTISDGAVSSTGALALGVRLLLAGRARACIAVGASAICRELALSAKRAGMLTPEALPRVFDRRHCGTALGEAAVAFVLERADAAKARGAEVKALVAGSASTFAPDRHGTAAALARACSNALGAAGAVAGDLAIVSSGANGVPEVDAIEAAALREALRGASPPISAVKSTLGESLDAGGLVQALAAIYALRSRKAPPIPGLEEPALDGLRYARPGTELRGDHALVTAAEVSGSCWAVVLRAA
jgi:3-oxoacyl-[acyl-carrier-protein] synthase II